MICRVFRKRKKFHLTFSNQYIFFLLLTTQHICVSTYYVPYHTESWRIKVARLTMYLLRLVTTWLLPAPIFGIFNNIKIKNGKKKINSEFWYYFLEVLFFNFNHQIWKNLYWTQLKPLSQTIIPILNFAGSLETKKQVVEWMRVLCSAELRCLVILKT